MKNILRNSNFGFKNRIMRMALLRSEPRKLDRSFGGLRLSLALGLTVGWMGAAQAQVTITPGATVTQNFSSLGTNGTATLPSGWRASKSLNVREVTAYSTAVTAVERAGGINLSTSAANGIYNFGSSDTDRAVGGLSSGSASKTVNLYVALQNTGGSSIPSFSISYKAERYRNGSNSAGFSIQMYYSTDGTTWTSAGSNFLSSFAANVDNNGAATVPIETKNVTSQALANSLAAGSTLYLAWNYSVTSGTTTSNAQALGVSDIEIVAAGGGGGTPPTITEISPSSGLAGTIVTITGTDFTGATAVRFNGVAADSFTVDSATTITATAPTGVTTGPISVTTAGGTGSSSGNFTVPVLSIAVPSSINEGDSEQIATVTATPAPTSDLTITLTSSSAADLTVDGGSGAGATATAIIFANTTDASFRLNAPADNTIDNNASVSLTAEAVSGYGSGTAIVTVRNVDLPSASLTGTGYTEAFSTFAAATPTLPLGWSATGATTTFPATANAWNEGTSGGFRGGASVLGYQHSSSTGTLVKTLTLKNETGATITDLTVSYKGRVARASEGRTPSYAVTVGGQAVPALAYSTADGDNTARTASLTGLSIANGTSFQISWSSDGSDSGSPGSGSRRQIGISEVSVTLGATSIAPSLSGLSIPIINVTRTQAQAEANVTADGGAALTKRGFVIAATSVNPDPEIGGTGVTNVEDAGTEVGLMTATFTGLSVGTGYTVKAYAINSVGTSYTAAQSFTTVGPALSFTGTYSESFDSYTGTVPAGWHAVSSIGVQVYGGEWGTGSAGGFRGTGATTGGILGYQPTTTTGDLTVTLSLINNTGATIETLNIGYLGRAARVDQTRISSWAVTLDGQAVADLAYSTDNTSGEALAPGDETKTTQLTGLAIANGTEFTLTWTSPNPTGSGASRQIGIADVVVSTSAPGPTAPSNLSYMPATVSGTVGTAISSLTPTVTGTVDTYSVDPALPDGLSIDAGSGVISGTPTAVAASDTYTVTAANAGGSTTATVTVEVAKGTPSITAVPTASAITDGQALSGSVLSGGTASVEGAFDWTAPSEVPAVGTATYGVTFTPTDTANYNTATTTVSLTVNPAGTTYSGWLGAASPSDAAFLDYVFGAVTPGTLDPSLKPTVAVTDGSLVLTYYVRQGTVGLTVTPKTSADLAAGPSGWVTTDVTVDNVGAAREVNGVSVQQKTASVPVSGAKKFLRVEAVQQ